jgi:beta-lactamase superfamily II metal-dependent hydrolase
MAPLAALAVMKTRVWSLAVLVVCLAVVVAPAVPAQQKPLTIYFLDMEGGGGTLLVSPSGESMLVDAGWPGTRDTTRILAAAKDAGLRQIDYFVASHYHYDHIGNVTAVAEQVPIRTFVDYGAPVEPLDSRGTQGTKAYLAAREKGRHLPVKAGDPIPIAGLDVRVVTAGGSGISAPLPGGGSPNPLCDGGPARENETAEDQRSVGVLVRHGRFTSMQLGDLTWNKELALVCPNNLLGSVDVFQTSAHGLDLSSPPALVHALRPRVVVMNNSGDKGASPRAWQTVRSSPGLEDLWQLHYSQLRKPNAQFHEAAEVGGKAMNVAESVIANIDDAGHFVKLTAHPDGAFVMTNGRTGSTRQYAARNR